MDLGWEAKREYGQGSISFAPLYLYIEFLYVIYLKEWIQWLMKKMWKLTALLHCLSQGYLYLTDCI